MNDPSKSINPSKAIQPAGRFPDFAGRPKGIRLERLVAVRGYGKLKLRPIRLDDEQEMVRFHEGLSEESIYLRYFEYLGLDRRTSHERLIRICTNTPESYAIVAERPATLRRPAAILAVGRLTAASQSYVASFDTLMIEDVKSPHLGKALIADLIRLARAFGFRTLTSELLTVDHDSINLCRALGFSTRTILKDGVVEATIEL